MNAHFPQNELARAEAYGIGKLHVGVQCIRVCMYACTCIPAHCQLVNACLICKCIMYSMIMHDLKP